MVIEYLQMENQILREKLGGNRVLLTDDQRRLLAVKGKALGRKQLEKTATIVQADTILRWHRELIQPTGNSKRSSNIGRPRKSQEVVNLVRRMARENVSWGYKRIEGAMHNLGYSICSSTVANILRQHGVDPAPRRQRTTSWSTFFKAHWDVFEGIDLHDIRLWIIEWLNGLFGTPSYREAIPIVAEASQEATQEIPKSIRIKILEVADTETQLARAPPNPGGPLPSMLTRDIRHAA
jgi:hypothetical protein